MVYADSHAHLPSVAEELGRPALDALLSAYEEAALALGFSSAPILVDIGTEPGDFAARFALLGDRAFLRYTLGVWPGREALADPEAALAGLSASLAEAGGRAAAVGECGLDYHHMDGSVEEQRRLFEGQIELAAGRGLPLVVHSREAFSDTLAILAAARLSAPVLIHCFGYGPKEAEAFLELGWHVSFAGNFTYKKAAELRAALAIVPAGRLLLETDAPYMNPEPRRGRPSSPLDIGRSYEAAAALRGVSLTELAATVAANARAVFGPGGLRA